MEQRSTQADRATSRRSFLRTGLAAGAATIGAGLLPAQLAAPAAEASGGLTPGDAAILRFLAALETLETNFWQQYNELGGVQDSEIPGGAGMHPTPRPWRCSIRTWPSPRQHRG